MFEAGEFGRLGGDFDELPKRQAQADAQGTTVDDTPVDGAPVDDRQADTTGDASRLPENTTGDTTTAAPPENAAADPEIVVKIDGIETRVKQSQLVASYQKDAASAKRFEEAAALRRAADEQLPQLRAEREALGQALTTYQAELQALQKQMEPDWNQLLQQDPAEFVRQRYIHEQLTEKRRQAQAAQAYLQQQQQADMIAQARARVAAEDSKLLEAIPEWKDATKREAGRQELRAALRAAGFQDSEINTIHDHRAVVVARKAAMYDKLVAEQQRALASANGKLKGLPPTPVARPGGGDNSTNSAGVDRAKASSRLSRTGSLEDAAALIGTLI